MISEKGEAGRVKFNPLKIRGLNIITYLLKINTKKYSEGERAQIYNKGDESIIV
ncbi:MAG: hypothetical protein Unbinned8454contig1000_16 [Prokaryotic dsDNA virus sp.]|nr:MAG: hypothetical protein Unbinned8454contig1000_16 [Prokaryotic dsDNA virus sp.]|tara:strand:- start:11700 stop:11861 length:162 start_codon:yes stop_codon:yes gene_type:complete